MFAPIFTFTNFKGDSSRSIFQLITEKKNKIYEQIHQQIALQFSKKVQIPQKFIQNFYKNCVGIQLLKSYFYLGQTFQASVIIDYELFSLINEDNVFVIFSIFGLAYGQSIKKCQQIQICQMFADKNINTKVYSAEQRVIYNFNHRVQLRQLLRHDQFKHKNKKIIQYQFQHKLPSYVTPTDNVNFKNGNVVVKYIFLVHIRIGSHFYERVKQFEIIKQQPRAKLNLVCSRIQLSTFKFFCFSKRYYRIQVMTKKSTFCENIVGQMKVLPLHRKSQIILTSLQNPFKTIKLMLIKKIKFKKLLHISEEQLISQLLIHLIQNLICYQFEIQIPKDKLPLSDINQFYQIVYYLDVKVQSNNEYLCTSIKIQNTRIIPIEYFKKLPNSESKHNTKKINNQTTVSQVSKKQLDNKLLTYDIHV